MEKSKEIFMYVLAALVFSGFVAIIAALILVEMPEQNRDVLYMLLGVFGGAFTSVISYFFGSSKGSADKNKLMKNG